MTRDKFINYLVENNIPYYEDTENGGILHDGVYVFDKKAYRRLEELKKHPRKYKYEIEHCYVPYLRVSHFAGYSYWYVRDNGLCELESESDVMDKVKRLGYV
jgi:hypothetical protein